MPADRPVFIAIKGFNSQPFMDHEPNSVHALPLRYSLRRLASPNREEILFSQITVKPDALQTHSFSLAHFILHLSSIRAQLYHKDYIACPDTFGRI
jgi:hypothetical protein